MAAFNVRVPRPDLVNPPAPLIWPPKLVLVLSSPAVRVAEPRVTLPPLAPPPAREPTATLLLFKSKTTPLVLAKVTAEPLPKAVVLPACRVPPFTVVAPW